MCSTVALTIMQIHTTTPHLAEEDMLIVTCKSSKYCVKLLALLQLWLTEVYRSLHRAL